MNPKQLRGTAAVVRLCDSRNGSRAGLMGLIVAGIIPWGTIHSPGDVYAEDNAQVKGEPVPIVSRFTAYEIDEWDEPLSLRDPEAAWVGQPVFQKSGIVIEDAGYIVKQRYWTLDEKAIGRVARVEEVPNRPKLAKLFVRYDGSPNDSPGWTAHEFEFGREVVSTTTGQKRIRNDSLGGISVESSESTVTRERNGQPVEENEVGLIVDRTEKSTTVRYPMHLVGRLRPQPGDVVVRGPDWCEGHADGGARPFGSLKDAVENGTPKYPGIVLAERDGRSGFIAVYWKATGRKTRHRFDMSGFYDIQVVPGQKATAEELEQLGSMR